jgi:hypothetical protein
MWRVGKGLKGGYLDVPLGLCCYGEKEKLPVVEGKYKDLVVVGGMTVLHVRLELGLW